MHRVTDALNVVESLEQTIRKTIRHALLLTVLLSFACCWAVSHVYLSEFRLQITDVREQQRETARDLLQIKQCLQAEPVTTAANP
jgi:hypothetical protein